MKKGAQLPTEKSTANKPQTDHKHLVWVQCTEHRCLAYLDTKGNWINFYTGEQFKDLIKVIE